MGDGVIDTETFELQPKSEIRLHIGFFDTAEVDGALDIVDVGTEMTFSMAENWVSKTRKVDWPVTDAVLFLQSAQSNYHHG